MSSDEGNAVVQSSVEVSAACCAAVPRRAIRSNR